MKLSIKLIKALLPTLDNNKTGKNDDYEDWHEHNAEEHGGDERDQGNSNRYWEENNCHQYFAQRTRRS